MRRNWHSQAFSFLLLIFFQTLIFNSVMNDNNNINTDNNLSLQTSPFSSQQEIVEVFSRPVIQASDISESISRGFSEKHKKKRSKLIRIGGPNLNATSSLQSGYPKLKATKKQEANAPANNIRPCSECGRQFWSWKALFGHMRCHPERQWRGINPPPNFRKPVSLPSSSTNHQGLELVLASNWSTNEEDYEAATCLLMLANSSVPISTQCISWYRDDDSLDAAGYYETEPEPPPPQLGYAEASAPSSSSNYRFECSSCKKVFGSHQALGGHRASHKNVKGCFAIAQSSEDDLNCQHNLNNDTCRTTEEGDKHEKTATEFRHKCGICFRVFSTGQALGGHMRCHWEKCEDGPSLQGVSTSASARDGRVLDLNLPPYPPPVETDTAMDTGLNSSSTDIGLDLRLGTI